MSEQINVGDIVTTKLMDENSSNTFLVDSILFSEPNERVYFLKHPLFPSVLIKKSESELNKISAQLKDSTERSIDFVSHNRTKLDFNSIQDLDSICLSYAVLRRLSPKQKSVLSNIAGNIARRSFSDDLAETMRFIIIHETLLDQFNRMWYDNFSGLFNGSQRVTSGKQRDSIFNIAGFIMAQLENPKVFK